MNTKDFATLVLLVVVVLLVRSSLVRLSCGQNTRLDILALFLADYLGRMP